MCLIVFDWQPHSGSGPDATLLLTLSANRDEFFRRDADPMQWWPDTPGVLARTRSDRRRHMGLGVTHDSRFAALTNFRAPSEMRSDAPTRGALVSEFLSGERMAPMDYLNRVARDGHRYDGHRYITASQSADGRFRPA